jgi:hypothetical protein
MKPITNMKPDVVDNAEIPLPPSDWTSWFPSGLNSPKMFEEELSSNESLKSVRQDSPKIGKENDNIPYSDSSKDLLNFIDGFIKMQTKLPSQYSIFVESLICILRLYYHIREEELGLLNSNIQGSKLCKLKAKKLKQFIAHLRRKEEFSFKNLAQAMNQLSKLVSRYFYS